VPPDFRIMGRRRNVPLELAFTPPAKLHYLKMVYAFIVLVAGCVPGTQMADVLLARIRLFLALCPVHYFAPTPMRAASIFINSYADLDSHRHISVEGTLSRRSHYPPSHMMKSGST